MFLAEIGDITRFAARGEADLLGGLTPKHHEYDTHVHRGRFTK